MRIKRFLPKITNSNHPSWPIMMNHDEKLQSSIMTDYDDWWWIIRTKIFLPTIININDPSWLIMMIHDGKLQWFNMTDHDDWWWIIKTKRFLPKTTNSNCPSWLLMMINDRSWELKYFCEQLRIPMIYHDWSWWFMIDREN